MRYGFLVAAAAVVMIASPAASQGVTIEAPGVGVHVGPDGDRVRDRDHDRLHERDVRGDCKTVTVQERGPDGSMVTRTKSNC